MIRSDLSVDWAVSPRIITVAAPSTEITIQDLHDSCRSIEASFPAIDEPKLIDSAGKENLGGGVAVGLTATLQDARVAFEARPGPTWTLCKITGGNLVALDSAGGEIDPREPTAYVTVDRTASSSATTQGIDAIAHMSFNNEVWHDVTRGWTKANFPYEPGLLGNSQYPASDPYEALEIATEKGLDQIRLTGTHNLTVDGDYSSFRIHGDSAVNDILTLASLPDVTNVSFMGLTLNGILDGGATIRECLIDGLTYFNGITHQSALTETPVMLGGTGTAMFLSCYSAVAGGNARPRIDFDNQPTNLAIRGWLGGLELTNKTTTAGEVSIDLSSGTCYIRSSCTAGEITVRGIGKLVDESGAGCTVLSDGLIDPGTLGTTVANAVWAQARASKLLNELLGKAVIAADETHVTIYEDDDTTISHEYDISPDQKTRTPV